MAFVQSVPLSQRSVTVISSSNATCQLNNPTTRMTANNVNSKVTSRRDMLRFLATGVAGSMLMATTANAAIKKTDDDFDLKELKKDVEELTYEEEVLDVGPDDREKNPTRTKKKVPEPEYRKEEKELVENEDKAYDTMVAKEIEDEAKIKAKFSKK